MPPTIAARAASENRRGVAFCLGNKVRIKSGTIFCQVDKRRQLGQEIAAMTPGNQAWAGGRPSFNASLDRSRIVLKEGEM